MSHSNMGRFTLTRKNSKREQTADGKGWRWVDDKDTNHTVEISIDIAAIVQQLAERATRTKAGKSIFMGGAVIVREVRP